MKGREKEAAKIRRANLASSVGRLMLGEISNWEEFFQVETMYLESLPRKVLKSGKKDVQERLSKEIRQFCNNNFRGMTESKLAQLYDEVKARRGVECPLKEFEEKYAQIKPEKMRGRPRHSTVVISLWGLQFKFPEDYLAKDIVQALSLARSADAELKKFQGATHHTAVEKKEEIASLLQKLEYASRSCVLVCFNLIEAYLNGLAWEFSYDTKAMSKLSDKERQLIQDTGNTSLRNKIIRYPEILSGRSLWDENREPVRTFLNDFKPFRDSLVHPSPFSAPEKFGGYDKLKMIYLVDFKTAFWGTQLSYKLIICVHNHLNQIKKGYPEWLSEVRTELESDIKVNI